MTGIERKANREESNNRYGRHNDCYQLHFFSSPASRRRRGIPSPPAGGWRLPVIASFGVGVGIGIGVDFFRSVFARFLANSIPSLAESSFS
jgi:hypothetical protein